MARTFTRGFFSDQVVNQAILDICTSHELTLFIGAGVSADQRIPTWAALVRQALADAWAMAAKAGTIGADANLDFKEIIDQAFQLPVASMADQLYADAKGLDQTQAQRLRNQRLKQFIYKNYRDPATHDERSLARQLLSFAATIKAFDPSMSLHIITTNYDDLLTDISENDSELQGLNIRFQRYTTAAPPRTSDQVIPIVHLHGLIPKRGIASHPVFSEADYVWWTHESPLRQYVTQRLDRGTTLMLGASLRDYNIVTYLKQTHIDDPEIKRYAILPTADDPLFVGKQAKELDALDQLRSARGRQLGVTILSPNYFGQVHQFLIEMENVIKALTVNEPYSPYMARLDRWWCELEPRFADNTFRTDATTSLRQSVDDLLGIVTDARHLKVEVWARSDIHAGNDPRHLELWCSSQFQYVAGRPGWPKRFEFGVDDSRAVVEAFAVRDLVVGEYQPDGRWTHVVALPVILSDAPYFDIPVGVVSMSLNLPVNLESALSKVIESNRYEIQAILESAGVAFLSPG